MSIWFRRKDAQGWRYYYLSTLPLFLFMPIVMGLVAIAVFALLSLFR